ncbi:MAG: histidinol dehydrogenase [Dehalococcoidia bacterium SM23_28_1]|nr:MAG: histidinol dehydrogenase [Dehalococcoidia bacterium SM23_28_1]
MRLVHGSEEGRRLLARLRRPLGEAELPPAVRRKIGRVLGPDLRTQTAQAVVDRILADVRESGDAAIRRYNEEIDGVQADAGLSLKVSAQEIRDAYAQVDEEVVRALRFAADRIRAYHQKQLDHSLAAFDESGLGQVVRPLKRVGMYVPGTTAVYPSSVLMAGIPARVAGVAELYMATPAAADGRISPLKLVAADITGVDGIFRAGGAQAIAALAFGSESIPRVDKICGPGNIFVALAKKAVHGLVGIDGIFGPTETLVVADDGADPALCAADLLAQAEHDALASPILITTSDALAQAVLAELEQQLDSLERRDIAAASLEGQGLAIVVETVEEALTLANEYAPEHLSLAVSDGERCLGQVANAGSVFVGGLSAEAVGDYTAGPSHVMPTGGSARFSSPLGVYDFLKVISVVSLDGRALAELGPAAVVIARAEGFTAHAQAIERRLEGGR